jgi:cell division protein FtsZ
MVSFDKKEGVEYICANTDIQSLDKSKAHQVIQIGTNLTKGLGAGANPQVGRQAAEDDKEALVKALTGADMIFVTAGMGGGTGTGAAPIVAQIAKELGALTVGVVTKPFPFEGKKRYKIAIEGIAELSRHVDSLITIPNEKLLSVLGREITLLDAFSGANDVLLGAVTGIAELITRPGLINVDFADVRTVMKEMGLAMMGSGVGAGDERAKIAAASAISSPLLDNIDLSGAKGVLVNITAGSNLSISEFEQVGESIREFTSDDATVIVGTVIDPSYDNELRVTLVATGLSSEYELNTEILTAKSTKEKHATITQIASTQKSSAEQEETHQGSSSQISHSTDDVEYFDIPSFLRKRQGS